MKVDNQELLPIIEEMLSEFMESKPDTIKVPSNTHEGSWNRVTTTFNPEWYRGMCSDFPRGYDRHNKKGPNKKKPRTIVKRKETIFLMERLIKNKKSESKYASYIIGEAERRLEIYSGNTTEWKGQF